MNSTYKPECGYYKQYLLLYLDFLGAKSRIMHDDNTVSPWVFGLESALSTISSYQRYRDRDDPNAERPYVKVFSDNVAVAFEVPKTEPELKEKLNYLIYFAGIFQTNSLAPHGWLIRGCLTSGYLYINKHNPSANRSESIQDEIDFFIGPALIRADSIEKELAIYPRIIVDRSAVEFGDTHTPLCEEIIRLWNNPSWLLKSDDGLYYLDYLNIAARGMDVEIKDGYRSELGIGRSILDDESKERDEKACAKIDWTRSYVDKALEKWKIV